MLKHDGLLGVAFCSSVRLSGTGPKFLEGRSRKSTTHPTPQMINGRPLIGNVDVCCQMNMLMSVQWHMIQEVFIRHISEGNRLC